MARPIDHDTISEVSTGTWEVAKGAVAGAAAIPVTTAILGGLIGVLALSGVGLGAAIVAGIAGAAVGAIGGTAIAATVGAPVVGVLAAIGAFIGLGNGASRVAAEKTAYRDKVDAREQKMANERSMFESQGIQQGYQAGFQEGQAYAVNRIQQELQQQAMMQQQAALQQHQELPADGHAAKEMARRGGHHAQHASKVDMVNHQREQAATTGPDVG